MVPCSLVEVCVLEHLLSPSSGQMNAVFCPMDRGFKNLKKYLNGWLMPMEESCLWEANSFLSNNESLCILQKLTFHYDVHRSPPVVPIVSYTNPYHTFSSYSFKIEFSINSHVCLDLWSGPFSFHFWRKCSIYHLFYVFYILHLSHHPLFYYHNHIYWYPKWLAGQLFAHWVFF